MTKHFTPKTAPENAFPSGSRPEEHPGAGPPLPCRHPATSGQQRGAGAAQPPPPCRRQSPAPRSGPAPAPQRPAPYLAAPPGPPLALPSAAAPRSCRAEPPLPHGRASGLGAAGEARPGPRPRHLSSLPACLGAAEGSPPPTAPTPGRAAEGRWPPPTHRRAVPDPSRPPLPSVPQRLSAAPPGTARPAPPARHGGEGRGGAGRGTRPLCACSGPPRRAPRLSLTSARAGGAGPAVGPRLWAVSR